MFSKQSMLEALRQKKGGLDIHIILGDGKEMAEGEDGEMGEEMKSEQRELGLAPEGSGPQDGDEAKEAAAPGLGDLHEDEAQDKSLIEEELAKAGLAKGGLASKARQLKQK